VVFFQNPDDRDLFLKLRLVDPAQIVLIEGSGVDLDHYAVAPSHDSPVFLMVARLVRDKGVYEYAEAAQLVKRRFPQARFLLVGPADSNPAALDLRELDQWVREGVLQYAGELKDVRPAMAECFAYVLPSYREGTPRTVLEAMSIGRAVITTDAPGCRETIVDGDSGLLVPVKNAPALANAMLMLLENSALARQMGKQARLRVVQKYDVRKVNAKIIRSLGLDGFHA